MKDTLEKSATSSQDEEIRFKIINEHFDVLTEEEKSKAVPYIPNDQGNNPFDLTDSIWFFK